MLKVSSRIVGLATAGLLAAGALLIPGTGSGAAPAPGMGSAFGVSATGLVKIAPTPTAPPNGPSVLSVNSPGLLTTGVLTASSTPNATGVTSTATVADVNALAGVVRASLITSTCTASGTTLTGSSTFAGLALSTPSTTLPAVGNLPPVTVPGVPINVAANPGPNTTITIPGVATLVLNEQTRSGDTLTVNAVRITSLLPVAQEVIIAQSVCTLAAPTGTTTTPPTTATTAPTASTTTRPTTASTTPATTPTTTGGSGGSGTAAAATPVQGRPAFTG